MPGLRKFSNVTLKRGIVKGDNDFAAWLTAVKLKVEGPQLKANGNEVTIETIES